MTHHPFEKAGLGKAPYRFLKAVSYAATSRQGRLIGVENGVEIHTKPGSSCDYCSTYIINAVWLQSADGRKFKVGCDCAEKVAKDVGDRTVASAVTKAKRDAKAAKDKARIGRCITALRALDTRRALRAEPHPHVWRAKQGDTRLDWAIWMLRNAGTSGKIQVCRYLKVK